MCKPDSSPCAMIHFGPGEANIRSQAWLVRDQAERLENAGTNAYRLASVPDGWVERLGEDILVSYKNEPVREALLAGAREWLAFNQRPARRIFGKLLPRQNAERVTPALISADPGL